MFILFLNLYYFKSFCYETYMTDNKSDFDTKSAGTLQQSPMQGSSSNIF